MCVAYLRLVRTGFASLALLTFAGPGLAQVPGDAALNALLAEESAAREAVRQTLFDGPGRPADIAERAEAMISRLGRMQPAVDPLRQQAAAEAIASLAVEAMQALPVLGVARMADLEMPPDATALDLGPPDSSTLPGFDKTDPGQETVSGDLRAIRRPDRDALFADGLIGVRQMRLPLPPGSYRIHLLTEDVSDGTEPIQPFGAGLSVNGRQRAVATAQARDWTDGAVLSRPGAPDREPASISAPRASRGGLLALEVEAGPDGVVIEFQAGTGATYLTGVIAEPANGPSVLALTPEARAVLRPTEEELIEAQTRIETAIASLIAQIATAAGEQDPAQLATLLQLEEPPAEPELTVSPN